MIERYKRYSVKFEDLSGYIFEFSCVPPDLPSNAKVRQLHDDRTIEVEKCLGSAWFYVYTGPSEDVAAHAVFAADAEAVRCDTIEVDRKHKRKGIATKLYDLAETIFQSPSVPSGTLSNDAKAFWKNRMGRPIF